MSESEAAPQPGPQAGEPLPSRRFQGREDFRALVRTALARAAAEGWREIILSDPDFGDWPLGERAVAEALQDWSASGRSMVLLARSYDVVQRQHARFVQWRVRWAHVVTSLACPGADRLDLPSALWSPGWVLERRDIERCAGWCGGEPDRRVLLREGLREWLQKATPSFPASTLGL